MKNVVLKRLGAYTLLSILLLLATTLQSCKKDEKCDLPIINFITRYSTGDTLDNRALTPQTAYTLHGSQFSGVGSFKINSVVIDDWGVNDDGTLINFNTPSDMVTSDSTKSYSDKITLAKSCGSSSIDIDILLPLPRITRISNEFALANEQITVEGTYFVNLNRFAFSPDGVGGAITDFTRNSLTLTVPSGAGSNQELVLYNTSNDAGTSVTGISFHNLDAIICDFDQTNTWEGTGGRVIASTASSYPAANGAVFVAEASSIAAGTTDVESMRLPVSFDKQFDYDGALSSANIALKFELYSKYDWNQACYDIEIGYRTAGNETEFAYTYRFQPQNLDTYSDIYVGQWNTISLPFNNFTLQGSPGTFVQSFGQLRTVNYLVFRFSNPASGEVLSEAAVAMDNFRIVVIGTN